MAGRTAYADCDGLSVAYQVTGDETNIDIVVVPGFVSHLDLLWATPECGEWLDEVSRFARLVIFDKLGTGLSDPVPNVRTIDDRVREIEAVISASGARQPVLFGMSEGAPSAVMYAASHPDAVRSLVLFGAFGRFGMPSAVEQPDISASEVRREMEAAGWTPAELPDIDQIERMLEWKHRAFTSWGDGRCLAQLLPSSVGPEASLGAFERSSASPGMARATLEAALSIDITPVLPTIDVPTLVIHARHDLVPIQFGRFIAEKIPNAELIELDGHDHAPWFSQPEEILERLERFLTGHHSPAPATRVLATVLFTDITQSTETAARLGDAEWRKVLGQFDAVTLSTVTRHRGTVVKSLGDGHLTTFSSPTSAIDAAREIRSGALNLGLETTAGAHIGEVELIGEDIGGLAVHIAGRIAAEADPGEILVSRTICDLVVGSGLEFDDRGTHSLKGVPDPWDLRAVRNGEKPTPGSPEAMLVRTQTPPPSSAMRLSDRAVARIARSSPRVLRSIARRLG